MHEKVNAQPAVQKSGERAFGIVMAVACLVIAGIIWFKDATSPWPVGLAGAAAILLVLGFFWQAPLRPLNRLWLKFGDLLHKIISPLVMGIIFFFIVTPIGLLMRLCGKDPMRMKLEPDSDSYWIERDDQTAANDMTKQF